MCDTMIARRPEGTLFAKNSDRPVDEVQLVEAHARRPAGGSLRTTYLDIPDAGAAALVGSRPTWGWGFEHGVNEHGVAVGNEEIWTVDDPATDPPALTGMDLVRLALERSTSADEAIDVITGLLATHGQGGIGNQAEQAAYFSSFLVADGVGGCIVETSGRTWAARPTGTGDAISNRLGLRTDWTRASADVDPGADFDRWRHPTMWTGHADRRLAASRAGCVDRAATVTPGDLAVLLRDHGGGPGGPPPPHPFDPDSGEGFSLCLHLRGYQATTSSMIVDLPHPATGRRRRAWFALGSPCASVFVPAFPPDAVSPALADPSVFDRFARLARMIEHDGSLLAPIGEILGPFEADLWDEADACIDDPGRIPGLIESIAPRLDDLLDRCSAYPG